MGRHALRTASRRRMSAHAYGLIAHVCPCVRPPGACLSMCTAFWRMSAQLHGLLSYICPCVRPHCACLPLCSATWRMSANAANAPGGRTHGQTCARRPYTWADMRQEAVHTGRHAPVGRTHRQTCASRSCTWTDMRREALHSACLPNCTASCRMSAHVFGHLAHVCPCSRPPGACLPMCTASWRMFAHMYGMCRHAIRGRSHGLTCSRWPCTWAFIEAFC
jgi:hypothetical protein